MDWYNGNVEMAINKALSEKKMFIVYIEGLVIYYITY